MTKKKQQGKGIVHDVLSSVSETVDKGFGASVEAARILKDAILGNRARIEALEKGYIPQPVPVSNTSGSRRRHSRVTPKPKDLNTSDDSYNQGDYMAVEAYLNARRRYKQEVDTRLQHDLPKAIVDAQETLRDENGLIDYDRLEDAGVRDTFKNAVAGSLEERAVAYFESDTEDLFKRSQLTAGYIGLAGHEMRNLIEQVKSGFSFEGFMKAVGEAYGKLVDPKLQTYAMSQLSEADENEVRNYMGLTRQMHGPDLTVPQMAYLIDVFEENGAVTPKALQKMPR